VSELLNDEERIEEIARMLGGVTITANTLATMPKRCYFNPLPATQLEGTTTGN